MARPGSPPRRVGILRRAPGDRGAALVEFALVMPLLFFLVFGIVEFGFTFGQHLDVRHGARETSRLVAVNYGQDETNQSQHLVDEVCGRLELADSVTFDLALAAPSATPPANERGDFAVVTLSAPVQQVTGLFSFALDGVTIDSVVETRLEQDATWTPGTYSCSTP